MKPLIAAIVLLLTVSAYGASAYHVIARLHLNGEGGWDYLTVDNTHGRLYVSRGTHVIVVETVTGKQIGDIPDTPGVHGIAVAPELRTGFISNGKANTASIFDLDSLRVIQQVRTGENPDAILYDPSSLRVFTFNGTSNDATVFSAASGSVLGTIPLGGRPEFATSDNKGRVFVNIRNTGEVVELDSRLLTITKRYSLKPCEEPTGMAIDSEHHRVFSGCRNRIMTVLDYATGTVTAAVPIGEGVDGTAYDPGTGLIFNSNGQGTLTVVRESSAGTFQTETIPTQRGARTLALDRTTHKIYLPAADFEGPGQAMKKGSFVVLVLGT